MKNFIKPDWNNSNLNISATLAEFLGAKNNNSTLPILKEELKKNYKNIVFICFDGMGINPLEINLNKNDFLRKNVVKTLTSTFPSTTTNATTSLITNLLPLEHGWLGWSLHFNKIKQNVDIYLHANSVTGEKIDFEYPIVDNSNCYFDNTNSDYNVTAILPGYVQTKKTEKVIIQTEDDLFDNIKNICSKQGKQFIYCYYPDPDSTMHEYGVSSKEAKEVISCLNNKIEKLYNEVDDTLFIVTADHGQVDVNGYIEFYKDIDFNSLLEYPAFLDARTPAFIVKKGKEKEFENLFTKKYGEDFILYKSKDLISQNYFGNKGEYSYLLGDYIAVGTYTHKLLLAHDRAQRFKGHHTSLTEEMLVPLIMFSKK